MACRGCFGLKHIGKESVKTMFSLNFKKKCPYCEKEQNVDFAEYAESTGGSERGMGYEIEYSVDIEEYYCEECEKPFRIYGIIWEYPPGVYRDETESERLFEDVEE